MDRHTSEDDTELQQDLVHATSESPFTDPELRAWFDQFRTDYADVLAYLRDH